MSFTNEDSHYFLEKTIGRKIDLDFIKNLNRNTEGWITGLRLYSLKLRNEVKPDSYNLPESGSLIISELLNEILMDFSPEAREYALKTSVLFQFNASIADFICKKSNDHYGRKFIELLEASNLFLIALDDRKGWYRYHHIFQDLLQIRFKQEYKKDGLIEANKLSADWLKERDFKKSAIIHYLKSDNSQIAIELFEYFRHQLLNNTNWQELDQVLNLFPHAIQEKSISLLLAKSWIKIYRGRPIEMFEDLPILESKINLLPVADPNKRRFLAELNCLLSYSTYNDIQEFQLLGNQCDFALNNLDQDQQYVKGYAWIFKMGSLQILGKYNEAKIEIKKALNPDKYSILNSHLYFVLNYLQWMEADIEQLSLSSKILYEAGAKNNNKEAIANGHHFYGVSKYLKNELHEAEEHLDRSYDHRFFTVGIIHIMNSLALATTYLAKQNITKAEKILDELKLFVAAKSDDYFNKIVDCAYGELYFSRGKIDAAYQKVQSITKLPLFPFSNFFVPQFTYLKILIHSEDWDKLKLAEDMLVKLLRYCDKTHNTLFRYKFLALKALLLAEEQSHVEAQKLVIQLLKGTQPEELIRVFLDNGPKMHALLRQYSGAHNSEGYLNAILKSFPDDGDDMKFSSRELDVLPLLSQPNRDIAEQLFIAEKTVKRHCNSIFKKLRVKNRREALRKAEEMKLM